ncbi:MAG: zinc ribbon domain-containing protein [Clostridiales Family XIII bacterium]|nr:zinc ribbon domain-containing protein [Clostridiales Family XIII bacterium]
MICKKCGAFLNDNSRYCARCGTDQYPAPHERMGNIPPPFAHSDTPPPARPASGPPQNARYAQNNERYAQNAGNVGYQNPYAGSGQGGAHTSAYGAHTSPYGAYAKSGHKRTGANVAAIVVLVVVLAVIIAVVVGSLTIRAARDNDRYDYYGDYYDPPDGYDYDDYGGYDYGGYNAFGGPNYIGETFDIYFDDSWIYAYDEESDLQRFYNIDTADFDEIAITMDRWLPVDGVPPLSDAGAESAEQVLNDLLPPVGNIVDYIDDDMSFRIIEGTARNYTTEEGIAVKRYEFTWDVGNAAYERNVFGTAAAVCLPNGCAVGLFTLSGSRWSEDQVLTYDFLDDYVIPALLDGVAAYEDSVSGEYGENYDYDYDDDYDDDNAEGLDFAFAWAACRAGQMNRPLLS